MKTANAVKILKSSPDYRLILSVLEKRIFEDTDMENCARFLRQEKIWKNLDSDMQLKWSCLAQMAGETKISLAVLEHLNKTKPEIREAWEARMEILSILEKNQELDDVCKNFLALPGNSAKTDLKDYSRQAADKDQAENKDRDLDAAIAPFDKFRRDENSIELFMSLFSGRENCFAQQWADKNSNQQGYIPVRRPMTAQDVRDHLNGKKTYGIYLLRSDARVNFAVLDADICKQFRNRKLSYEESFRIKQEKNFMINRISELSKICNIMPLAELSGGKGFHFWYFFKTSVLADMAKNLLENIKSKVVSDLKFFNLEVFPKQAELSGKGLGNLVKLPLGIHRVTGRPSYFIDCQNRGTIAQLEFLKQVCPEDPENIKFTGLEISGEVVPLVKPHKTTKERNKSEFPELEILEKCCEPVAGIINLCRQKTPLSLREEKIIYQTLGFLPNARAAVHYIMAFQSDYNPHMVDYRLSRVRGTPLGCRRIHSLMEYEKNMCRFKAADSYFHPLLHLDMQETKILPKSEKIENIGAAIENLKTAIAQVERFLL